MTVIAAIREHDTALLIAADTGGEENPGQIPIVVPNKLRRHPSAPLAWAAAGNETIGADFSEWLVSYAWPPQDWKKFRDEAIEYLSQLNGRQRELLSLARKEPAASDTAVVLVAGWLGTPEILELGDDAKVTSYIDDGFHAVGSGKAHAYIAHRTLEGITGSPIEKVHRLATVAAIMAPKSSPPVVIWRVTPDGVEEVDGKGAPSQV